jgi:hypothetical protein
MLTIARFAGAAPDIEFGSVVLGRQQSQQLTLVNPAPQAVEVAIDKPAHSSRFTLGAVFPLTVPPGGSVAVGVNWSPEVPGRCSDRLSFVTSNKLRLRVDLYGTGAEVQNGVR